MSELEEAKTNMISGLLIALFSIGFYAETYRFKLVNVINSVDAAFFPRIMGIIVFICSSMLFYKGYKAYRKIPPKKRIVDEADKKMINEGLIRSLKVFLIMLLASIMLKKLGFILTMPWMMFILFCIVEKKDKRRYKLYLALSVASPIVLFIVFYYGFSSLLPIGILKPLLTFL